MRVPYRPQTMEVGQLILRWLFIRGQPLVDEVASPSSSSSCFLLYTSLIAEAEAAEAAACTTSATSVRPLTYIRWCTTSSLQCTYAHLYLLYNAEQSDKQSAASAFEAARLREALSSPIRRRRRAAARGRGVTVKTTWKASVDKWIDGY